MSTQDQHDQTEQRTDVEGLETQDVPEDEGVLQPSETLESDDLAQDPLDTGISPPERHPASERFGVTEAEARQGETLDQRLAQEVPDQDPRNPAPVDAERAGRLVAADEGAHPVDAAAPRQFAREVGRDGGAASAEEAAVHLVPEDESGVPENGSGSPDPEAGADERS